MHRKVQNDKDMRKKLVAKGYKSFSKLSAAGGDTAFTLRSIIKCRSMKYIRKLEFDPYLCEESCLEPLTKVLKKFKDIKEINLVIRRLNYVNESDVLVPFMIRMLKMRKLRLELSKVEKLNDDGMIKLAWVFGRLYAVEEFEEFLVGLDHISPFADSHFAKEGQRLRRLKRLRKLIQKSSFMKYDSKVISEKITKKMGRSAQFREMDMRVSMPKGWLTLTPEDDKPTFLILAVLQLQKYLEKLNVYFCGNPVPLESVESMSMALPKLPHLRSFSLEFLNSGVSESEIILFAQTLPQLKALERLRFKVIQYPNVSEGSIYYLMGTLSKLPNIKHFEIYFRRLSMPEEMIQELVNRIQQLENIQCCATKQSLSFVRTEKKE